MVNWLNWIPLLLLVSKRKAVDRVTIKTSVVRSWTSAGHIWPKIEKQCPQHKYTLSGKRTVSIQTNLLMRYHNFWNEHFPTTYSISNSEIQYKTTKLNLWQESISYVSFIVKVWTEKHMIIIYGYFKLWFLKMWKFCFQIRIPELEFWRQTWQCISSEASDQYFRQLSCYNARLYNRG